MHGRDTDREKGVGAAWIIHTKRIEGEEGVQVGPRLAGTTFKHAPWSHVTM